MDHIRNLSSVCYFFLQLCVFVFVSSSYLDLVLTSSCPTFAQMDYFVLQNVQD